MSVRAATRVAISALVAFPMVLSAQGNKSRSGNDGGGHAMDFAIAVRAGTLGGGAEISKLLVSHVGVRVGGYYFKLTDNGQKIGDSKYDLEVKLNAFEGLLDLYPGARGSFHVTAGVVTRPLKGTGHGVGTIVLNGNHYTSSQTGALTVGAEFPSAMPYIGLGFGTAASRHGGLSFVFDLGAAIGKPKFTLSAANASTNTQLGIDVDAERAARQKDDFDKFPGYPVLSLGLSYRF